METKFTPAINVLIFLSLYAGASYYAVGNYFMAGAFVFIGPMGLLFPRFIYKNLLLKKFNISLFALLELLAIPGFLLPAFGSLSIYSWGIEYDSLVHFFFGGTIFFLLVILLKYAQKGRQNLFRINLFAFFLTFYFLVFWELYQYANDQLFGTKLFFDFSQPIEIDVLTDLAMGISGALITEAFVYVYLKSWLKKWKKKSRQKKQTVRRLHPVGRTA